MKTLILLSCMLFVADFSYAKSSELVSSAYIKPMKTVCSIKFKQGSSRLTSQHKRVLTRFSKSINSQNYAKNTIRIEGYGDGGNKSDNRLSFERSRVVENFLLKSNPKSKDFFITGLGSSSKSGSSGGMVEIVVYDDRIDMKSRKVDELVTNLSEFKANQ